jgi:hypothetical protein
MNELALKIAQAGGVFAFLTFVHFFADWLWQSHDEAMKKATDSLIRAKHCLIYTAFFVVPLVALGLNPLELTVSLLVLYWSHFFEDTYIPVLLWAKYIRKAPEFLNHSHLTGTGISPFLPEGTLIQITADQGSTTRSVRVVGLSSPDSVVVADDTANFIAWASTPLGKILMIAVDQIIHILFLWVPAYFAVN